ncbi:ribosome maturation factor RimM [Candidatus Hepatobacter penaei]|uniref:ribosome maturation factor RimM n=1 Tax=Candidatus Hepatobacter penaei TaxID=1274402 RepID=UPI000A7A4FC3|nr:ribosome maturation factor RimM [Candidatus Hepatobacter penaei]
MGDLVCVGRILGVHGLKGLLKVHSFTEPPDALFSYPCLDKQGDALLTFDTRSLSVRGHYQGRPFFLVGVEGCSTREQASLLVTKKLYIPKKDLPGLDEDVFYHHALESLAVLHPISKAPLGHVRSVHNFGAGDLLDVKTKAGPSLFVPFRADVVADISLENSTLSLTSHGLTFFDIMPPSRSSPKPSS